MSTDAEPDYADRAEARTLDAALHLTPSEGWTWPMTFAAGRTAGLSAGEVELLLPHGPRDLAALLSRRYDRAAMAALESVDPAALKIRERIRQAVSARLRAAAADAPAVRRWTGFLTLPANIGLGLRLAWESADGLWRWAGDTATDENHYTKRAILSGILISGLAIWLADGEEAALAHLDRRIEGVMAFEKFKARVKLGDAGRMLAETLGRVRYARI